MPALNSLCRQGAERSKVCGEPHRRGDSAEFRGLLNAHQLERDLRRRMDAQRATDDPEGERLLIAVTEAAEPEDLDALVAHYADCSEGAAT